MNKPTLQNLIDLLFNENSWSDKHINVTQIAPNHIRITYGQMYESPTLNFKILSELSEMFGTKNIDVDDFSQGGCDTCDYGSDYGHDIDIKDFTACVSDVVGKKWKKD
jgi:hypothetical protein